MDLVIKATGCKKAGHAGTLDPIATGVLVVCLERATLLSGFLSMQEKEYAATFLLGLETDTLDIEGKVISRGDSGGIDISKLREAASSLEGDQIQEVPKFSAVKVGGRPLYYYARREMDVSSVFRRVRINSIKVISLENSKEGVFANLVINCGPGTYVRSIARDLGRKLGCGACVYFLTRTRSGNFKLDDALSIEELSSLNKETILKKIITMEEATSQIPSITLSGEALKNASMGKYLSAVDFHPYKIPDGTFRILDDKGVIIALYTSLKHNGGDFVVKPLRVIRPYKHF